LENIKIKFPNWDQNIPFQDVPNALKAGKSEKEKFYYIFCYRDEKKR